MTDVEVDGVGSGKVPRARVSVLCSLSCTGIIGLWKDFGFLSGERATVRLRLRIMMKRG